ncbi:pyridoxal 5'-phosphate synthase glutaminase subunit PdxT [Nitrolancea hollandica]|uniref:Pyridoxal 5'-phosphate synthase subunit PdxT n=1 Tax=Nitrolancea hollandica Lb TaxID=1129897 RepID=I4EEA1_9BACT|nr:pyridoxal 5'-phosphate synthase glutaminase subunit PdxT [Nitrolancea hollandica]CCF83013.1 glutamine amidotransferase for pyridoxal phosphate synthesis [Nitrolancea hollandica Lb]
MPVIGVLALQGAFIEHIEKLKRLGIETREVRLPADLEGLDGLIIPGGESTTIGKLIDRFGLREPITRMAAEGTAIWGTCAGMILVAREVDQETRARSQPLLGLMDMTVRRNAFGSQLESFETALDIPEMGGPPFPAVFIRAPIISTIGPGVQVLARLPGGEIVAARQGNLIATAFHPELTTDDRLHAWFASLGAGTSHGSTLSARG